MSVRAQYFYNNLIVPCGHCSQCLKSRQNDLAVRCAIEARKRGSMIFVTLTYRDDTLPVSCSLECVDKDSGECFRDMPCSVISRDTELYKNLTFKFSQMDRRRVKYVYSDILEIDNDLYRYCFTPSISNRDVQLWLKSCRVQYFREFKLPLKKFSYVAVGEYGPNTNRPHYHLAFFGLAKHVVDWMCSRWNRQFGFSYVQKVNAINEDGSNGFDICSRYIGKYLSKGKFECESVGLRYSKKPRLLCSIGIGDYEDGVVLPKNLVDFFRCTDLVGDYSINGFRSDGTDLVSSDFDKISKEVKNRSKLSIGGYVYPLPKKILKYVWYQKNAEGSFVSSVVRREVVSRLQTDLFEDFVRKHTKDYSLHDFRETSSLVSRYLDNIKKSNKIADERGFDNLQRFYSSSKF